MGNLRAGHCPAFLWAGVNGAPRGNPTLDGRDREPIAGTHRMPVGSIPDQKPISGKIHANNVVDKEIVANQAIEPGW
jgi:hypothetical protein